MTPVTFLILGATALITYLGFQNRALFDRYAFRSDRILRNQEWIRLISSGFLHVDWMHFGMNAFTIYSFAQSMESIYGGGTVFSIYFGSMIGGNLLSLFLHKKEAYVAVGASGGACGIVFASIFLMPGMKIMVFPVPIGIPAWLYSILFLLASVYGIKKQKGNIGHDAHFGGAIVGILLALAIFPGIVLSQLPMLFLVLGLSVALLFYLLWNSKSFFSAEPEYRSNVRYQRYDENKVIRQELVDIDQILDKISRTGINSLTRQEREQLEAHSRTKK